MDAGRDVDALVDGGCRDVTCPLGPEADALWAPSSIAWVDPREHGAVVDDGVDDTDALMASVEALPPEGGVVWLPEGELDKTHRQWLITRDHVLLWAPGGRTTLFGSVEPRTAQQRADGLCGTRQQALNFRETVGGGVWGLKLRSDANERMSCAEDAQIVLDGVDGFEVVGVEVDGAATNAVFMWARSDAVPATRRVWLEGNYFHHTWADAVHQTRGTRQTYCYRNFIFNEAPSLGDDGIACVTYDVLGARCGQMEWWDNAYLGGAHGRGYAVVGGEDIRIHHNWVISSAAAGLIVASESSYSTPGSDRIVLNDNWLIDSPDGTVSNGHSAILVSGNNPAAEPIRDVAAVDNVVINPAGGRVERAEGQTERITFDNTTDAARLPRPPPTLADARVQDTAVLRTRDTALAPEAGRRGLYRVHLRMADGAAGATLEVRYEYVVAGASEDLASWLEALDPARVRRVTADLGASTGEGHALLLSAEPLTLPDSLAETSFETLREGAREGRLDWLWQRLDAGDYGP